MGRLYSFDMFDTLVSRAVRRPVDVFSVMAAAGGIEYRCPLFSLLGFSFYRILSEKLARKMSRGSEDVSIFEIYRILGWFVKRPSTVLRMEVNFELRLSTPIRENLDKLCELVSSGAQCCILSDMYLPRHVLTRILRRHVAWLDVDIFVSAEWGVTKWSGGLFKLASKKLGVPLSNFVHVGDNFNSDVRVPSSMGVAASHFKVKEYTSGRTIFERFKCSSDDDLVRVGYELVGPLSVAFAGYVDSASRQDGIDNLVFSGRDSYLFKRAHDLFYGGGSRYFRVSRRAVYLAEIAASGDFSKLFEGVSTGVEFFRRIGLSCPDELKAVSPCFNVEKFLSELGKQEFHESAKKELDAVLQYLRANGFSGKVAYVDIGWRGSIQDSIERILGRECTVFGYYFGTVVSERRKKGFFFRNRFPFWRFFYIFQALPIFEFLFTEPIRSLKRVSVLDGDFAFEFVNDESDEQILMRESIAKGAEAFYQDYARVHDALSLTEKEKFSSVTVVLKKVLLNPSPGLVGALSTVYHSAGFGGSSRSLAVDSVGSGLLCYLKSPWKAVYLNRVFRGNKAHKKLYEVFFFTWPFFISYEMLKVLYRLVRRSVIESFSVKCGGGL